MRAISPTNVALGGISRQMEAFDRAAANVVQQTTQASTSDPVQISSAARGAGGSSDSAPSAGVEGAMVDVRIAKYLTAANVKVLQTANDLEKTVEDLVR
jgi:hypothetical protein